MAKDKHTCDSNGLVIQGAMREVKPGVWVVTTTAHCSVCGVPTLSWEGKP